MTNEEIAEKCILGLKQELPTQFIQDGCQHSIFVELLMTRGKIFIEEAIKEATKEMWTDEDMLNALHDGQKCAIRAYHPIDKKIWLESLKQKKNNLSNTANVPYPTQAE